MSNLFTREVLVDFVASVIWPAMTVHTATTAQTDFDLPNSWDTGNDTILAWKNGARQSGMTWVDADTVQLAAPCAADDVVHILITPGGGTNYLPRTGLAAMLGNLLMGGFQVTGLGASTQNDHAVRRDEVEALALASGNSSYLRRDGTNWPPVADLALGNRKLTGLGAATAAGDAVRRDLVALLDGSQPFTAPVGGVTPTDAAHLATKGYVDATAAGTQRGVFLTRQTSGPADIIPLGNGQFRWRCPDGVTTMRFHGIGGGGGGSSGEPDDGSAIGAGSNGSDTSFGGEVVGAGGQGCSGATHSGGTVVPGAAGGTTGDGITISPGQAGGDGTHNTAGGNGGNGYFPDANSTGGNGGALRNNPTTAENAQGGQGYGAGGGGGGGGDDAGDFNPSGGGGGGAGYGRKDYPVTPGVWYTVVIGMGGAGGDAPGTPGAGGQSTDFVNGLPDAVSNVANLADAGHGGAGSPGCAFLEYNPT